MTTEELKLRKAYFYSNGWGEFATFKKNWFVRKYYYKIGNDFWADLKEIEKITT